MKSGRTAAGSRAASSHTAALAAPDVAVDALFRQAGVIRVDTLDELLSTAMVLAHQPLPAGRRVAIVSNAGGPGILAADACAGAGLEVPELDAGDAGRVARGRARRRVGAQSGRPGCRRHRGRSTRPRCGSRSPTPSIDAVIAIFVPPLVTQAHDVARAIVRASDAAERQADRVVLPRADRRARRAPRRRERGGRSRRSRFPSRPRTRSGESPIWPTGAGGRRASVPHLAGIDVAAGAGGRGGRARPATPEGAWLDPGAAAAVLACFGIPVVGFREVTNADEARLAARALGFPVVLKASAPSLVHKSDVGGVALDLRDEASVDGGVHAR